MFWQLLSVELGGTSVSSVVSDGELSASAIGRLRVKLKVTRTLRGLIGREYKERADFT